MYIQTRAFLLSLCIHITYSNQHKNIQISKITLGSENKQCQYKVKIETTYEKKYSFKKYPEIKHDRLKEFELMLDFKEIQIYYCERLLNRNNHKNTSFSQDYIIPIRSSFRYHS